MTGRSVPVIVNHSAGTASNFGAGLAERIGAAFTAAGLTADVEIVAGADVAASARRHANAPLVVIGGGDGTLGSALPALRGTARVGILPLGTRNHLARDLGIPPDLAGAVGVIAAGATRAIDLASVNGHAFVNNASVGLYPLMVRHRDAGARRGWPKWLATIPAAWAALSRLRHHRMYLEGAPGADRDLRTPLLFVGNNLYALDLGHIGRRASLDDGTLSVFAVAAHSRLGLLWFAVRALLGRSDETRDFAAVGECATLTIRSRARRIDIALDGEVHRLHPPLRFTVAPGAIRVCVPAPSGA